MSRQAPPAEAAVANKVTLLLDIDHANNQSFRCPLSVCSHHTTSLTKIMQHIYKYKGKNAPNKSCRGRSRKSQALILYPKLFLDPKSASISISTLAHEYPEHDWKAIKTCIIGTPGAGGAGDDSDSEHAPDCVSLMQQFHIFITDRFMALYPGIKIPKSLQDFIVSAEFDANQLPSLLRAIKTNSACEAQSDDNDNDIDIDMEQDDMEQEEPGHKKRKVTPSKSVSISLSNVDLAAPGNRSRHLPTNASATSPSKRGSHSVPPLSFDLNNDNDNNNDQHDLVLDMPSPDNSVDVVMHSSVDIAEHVHHAMHTHHMHSNTHKQHQPPHKRRRCVGPMCNACHSEINPCQVMLECAECVPVVTICLPCFQHGKEFGTHKRFHRYRVLRPLTEFRIEADDACNSNSHAKDGSVSASNTPSKRNLKQTHRWTVNDEWNLLHGLRRYGVGNWNGIAKLCTKHSFHARTEHNFDSKRVESHFHRTFGPIVDKPQPDDHHENASDREPHSSVSAPPPPTYRRHSAGPRKHRGKKSSAPNDDSSGGGGGGGGKKSSSESKFIDKHKLKCGYKEKRDEFEAEWNNDAEAMIGEMYFSEYDTDAERKLKLEGLRLYNQVLDERKVRKKFIKEYGVIYNKKTRRNVSEHEQKLEDEIASNLSMFARFTEDKNRNFAEFKSLCVGLVEEKKLREKIYTLRHYLLNGVTSVRQMQLIEKYVQRQQLLKATRDEAEQRKREGKVKRVDWLRNIGDSGHEEEDDDDDDEDDDVDVTRGQSTSVPFDGTSEEYLNRYHGCSLDAISTYLSLVEAEETHKLKPKSKALRGRRKSESQLHNLQTTNSAQQHLVHSEGDGESAGDTEDISRWNLAQMQGFASLNDGERKLCNVLKIAPLDYRWIQQQISNRVYRHALLRRDRVPQQLYIDIGDVKRVRNTMEMRIGLVDPQRIIN